MRIQIGKNRSRAKRKTNMTEMKSVVTEIMIIKTIKEQLNF
jgi:hypothetical protein